MELVIITGMSGAGKSTALKMFEDNAYYCVDNLPVLLIPQFIELTLEKNNQINRVALGIDVRNGENLSKLEDILETIKKKNFFMRILFLDSNDEVLVKRFKETRRAHPLSPDGRIDDGIKLERQKLTFLKKSADIIIDTSYLLTRELKAELDKIFVNKKEFKNLQITILSFGFKNGIPTDSDLVFDVRFIPNPFYIEELKTKTGLDKEVRDYCMSFEVAGKFVDKLSDMLDFLIPNYIIEGKNQLVISIGCTGGKHRSVTIATEIYQRLIKKEGYAVKLKHRDVNKEGK
ncbi:RNase adapter RapZ [Acetitomaculum ruminis]|uniref:RNase adapter RapZ n=1 Tax=Acetitomaculum ruminis TaxID=2382 RepID=UPI000B875B02